MGKGTFFCIFLALQILAVLAAIQASTSARNDLEFDRNSNSNSTELNSEVENEIKKVSVSEEKALVDAEADSVGNPKRNGKFGFSFPYLTGSDLGFGSSTPYPNSNYNQDGTLQSGIQGTGVGGTGGLELGNNIIGPAGIGIASTVALVKSGVLKGITALKIAVLPPLFIGAVILFLIAGAAFFTCNVVDCRNALNSGSTYFTRFFNRNGYESSDPYSNFVQDYYYENQFQPVYQAIEESYKKYGTPAGNGGKSRD